MMTLESICLDLTDFEDLQLDWLTTDQRKSFNLDSIFFL